MPTSPATCISPDNPVRGLVVEPDGGQRLWVAGHRITIKATAQDTGGVFGVIESRAPVGGVPFRGPPVSRLWERCRRRRSR